jgi:hypothetical protein
MCFIKRFNLFVHLQKLVLFYSNQLSNQHCMSRSLYFSYAKLTSSQLRLENRCFLQLQIFRHQFFNPSEILFLHHLSSHRRARLDHNLVQQARKLYP